jgi:hypothetical protein
VEYIGKIYKLILIKIRGIFPLNFLKYFWDIIQEIPGKIRGNVPLIYSCMSSKLRGTFPLIFLENFWIISEIFSKK